MRYLLAFVVIVACAAGGIVAYRHFRAGPVVVLPRPVRLEATMAGGAALLPGGWSSSATVTLHAVSRIKGPVGADVEVRPTGEKFSNTPTTVAAAPRCPANAPCGPQSADPPIAVHLSDGDYHWQVRLHNGDGVSPWTVSPTVIRVDTQPPAIPLVISPTDPNPHKVYHRSTIKFDWHTSDAGSGVAGYSYRLDTDPHGQTRREIRTSATSITLKGLSTGTYYFHVRPVDEVGNWGQAATFPVRIDVTPPGLAFVRFSRFEFDPQFDPLRVAFAVDRPAKTVRVGVYRQDTGALVRLYQLTRVAKGEMTAITWHGRDNGGRAVGPGTYAIYIRAIDRYGHTSLSGWRDFIVDYRRVLVSLSQQRLWAYDGNRVVLTSLVTTGNRALPTPTGLFHVEGKFHPFTFKSPWPKSSPYYYPPSKVQYAILFQEGGYFIHDAPWRSAFGPGTNSQLGTPGQNYTGTHGCVNTPPDVAQRLFDWTSIGTVVQVVQ